MSLTSQELYWLCCLVGTEARLDTESRHLPDMPIPEGLEQKLDRDLANQKVIES